LNSRTSDLKDSLDDLAAILGRIAMQSRAATPP
jgi:hypothetical protein